MPARALHDAASVWYEVATGDATEMTALRSTQRYLGANVGNLISVRSGGIVRSSATFSTVTDQKIVDQYFEFFEPLNPIMPAAIPRLERGAVVRSSEVIAKRELSKTQFYNDYMAKIGSNYEIGVGCEKHPEWDYILQFGRGNDCGDFDDRDMDALHRIAPHIQRAISIRRAFNQHSALSGEMLRAVDASGLIMLSATGRVLGWQGELVELLIAQGTLDLSGSVLQFKNSPLESAYESSMARIDHPSALAEIVRVSWRTEALRFAVIPVDLIAKEVLAIDCDILVVVAAQKLPLELSIAAQARKSGLTRREEQLVIEVLRGKSLSETADTLEIAVATVRTHLKSVFSKTGTHSQAQLVAFFSDC